jgi:outer membrane protein OmpA-like peptidoglycan-associated protein
MALEAYGEEQLKVPTADGTAEPRNRRVEITFKNDAR